MTKFGSLASFASSPNSTGGKYFASSESTDARIREIMKKANMITIGIIDNSKTSLKLSCVQSSIPPMRIGAKRGYQTKSNRKEEKKKEQRDTETNT